MLKPLSGLVCAVLLTACNAQEQSFDEFFPWDPEAENVQETESGLQYEVIEEGDGDKPTASDRVQVHYTGELINGEVFDSSRERGKPTTFGVGQVIPGWIEGLQLMSEGAEYELTIPSNLAYGAGGAGAAIGPNEVLIFKVELVAVVSQ